MSRKRYLENLLEQAGASVEAIHNHRDPFWRQPARTNRRVPGELRKWRVKGGLDLGLALDGDADRFGIVDSNGEFITPNQYLPVLFYHLLNARGLRGPVAPHRSHHPPVGHDCGALRTGSR